MHDIANILIGVAIIAIFLGGVQLFKRRRPKMEPPSVRRPTSPRQPAPQISRLAEPLGEEVEPPLPPIDPAVTEVELRQQLREIADPEECWEFYLSADHGSVIEREAYEKFVSLFRSAFSAASSFEDYDGLFALIADKDEEELVPIRDEITKKILDTLPDFDSAIEFYEAWDWDDEDDAFTDDLLKKALELAATTDNAKDVYDIAERDSDLEAVALSRMVELSETVEDCQAIWDDHGVDTVYGRLAITRAAAIIAAEPPEEEVDEEDEEEASAEA